MAAEINFFSNFEGGAEIAISGSGLGFYGATFGSSVQVGEYQDTTFVTNSNGSINGGQVNNNKYPGNSSGVVINGGSEVQLNTVPVESGTLNVRFTFDSPVQTQNGELRIFDRTSSDNPASGVTTQVAQIVQNGSGVNQTTGDAQASHNGWMALGGSGTTMTLLNSPGESGLSPSGASTVDDRHDWYVALSASPDSIGSKTQFGLFTSTEFL